MTTQEMHEAREVDAMLQQKSGQTTVTIHPKSTPGPKKMKDIPNEFKQVTTPMDFLKFLGVLCGVSCGIVSLIICSLIWSVIPVAMIIIGAIYKDRCNIEPLIPIYLIVGGAFGIVKSITNAGTRKNAKNDAGEDIPPTKTARCCGFLDHLVSLFLFAWLICGAVWVYRNYSSVVFSYNPPTPDVAKGVSEQVEKHNLMYCHPTVYWFAFALVTISLVLPFILLGFLCIAGCIACCCIGCIGANSQPQNSPA